MPDLRTKLESLTETPEPAPAGRTSVPIRMPRELHKQLKELAWAHKLSLNALCTAALEHVVGELRPASAQQEAVA